MYGEHMSATGAQGGFQQQAGAHKRFMSRKDLENIQLDKVYQLSILYT